MQLFSRLPLSMLFFKHWSPDDREIGVVLAKAAFRRDAEGHLRVDAAPDIGMEDIFEGDPAWSPLLAEQDIAPMKRGTDLTISAVARSAEGKPRQDWAVEVSVPDHLHYQFHVRGPSVWSPRRRGWERSPPELVTEVPLSYGLAYGGRAPGPKGDVVHGENPAGLGLVTRERLDLKDDIAAPQIGLLGEFLSEDPNTQLAVHGTGPVAKSWLPRRAFAGTLDADWLADRHPRMPLDYDMQFWNAAPGPLQIKDGLSGGQVVQVTGVTHNAGPLETALPPVWCGLRMGGAESAEQAMALDTVHLDLRTADPADHKVTLIWRAQVDRPDRFSEAEVISGRIGAP